MFSKSKTNTLVLSLVLSFGTSLYSYNSISATYFIDNQLGSDKNTGTKPESAWKSLDKINNSHIAAGDEVLFKRNQKWRGTLIVNSSGKLKKPITYSSYGDGSNPIIMRTVEYADWKLVHERSKNSKTVKIWSGQIKNLKNSWGMVKDSLRTASFTQYSGKNFKSLPNGYFYAPLNQGIFYFRNDAGNPGKVEIGSKKNAILIKDQNYIVIDNIDSFGPGGRHDSGGSTGFKSVDITGNSSHIKIRHMTISHSNSIGISANFKTSNITYSNITSHNNGGTGIYMNSKGGSILNCKSFDNGRLVTDKGDRGGIGSFKGSNILVRNNEVYHNGSDDDNADFEISIVGTGPVIIEKNHIHDCIQGCLQIAEGGDNSIIAYNIISHYGTTTEKVPSGGKYSGIRIGGGTGGAKNVKIINNVIHGGQQPFKSREAALYIGGYNSSNLLIQNNIFSNNINKNIYIRSNAKLDNLIISNNIYSIIDHEIGINWKEQSLKSLAQWKLETGHGNGSYVTSDIFINKSNDFKLPDDFQIKKNSPAINGGMAVKQNSDFYNNTIPNGKSPDIGAFEYYLQ